MPGTCEELAESLIHRATPHKVLGRKLLPFSLWHYFLLSFYQSPFVSGEPMTLVDLEKAVRICRCKPKQTPKTGGMFLVALLYGRQEKLEREFSKFCAYIADYNAPPRFLKQMERPTSSNNRTPPPPELSIAIRLMELGFTEEGAWGMPLGKAHWYCAAHAAAFSEAELDFDTLPQEQVDAIIERLKEKKRQPKTAEEEAPAPQKS